MNKNIVWVSILVVLLPGCWGKKQKSKEFDGIENGLDSSSGYQKTDKKSLFDEDVEGFVLEEGFDPFTGNGEEDGSLTLIDAGQEASSADTRAGQAAYGLKTVYFDFDKYDIRDDQKEILDHDIHAVRNAINKGMDDVVEGHADRAAGSAQYNMQLSHKRAENVAHYFIERGISAKNLKIVGRGFEMPIVPTGTKEQQTPNRRVELYVIKAAQE